MATPKSAKKRLILLDSHAIIHRAYHALPEFTDSKGEPTGALYGLSTMIMKIVTDLKPDYVAACYDLPKKTFRHEAYEAYKGKRAKIDDALVSQLIASRRIFEAFSIPIYDKEGFEADDCLGTIVEQMKDDKNIEIIIASGDMDTLQLVTGKKVQVFTLKKGLTDTVLYDEDAVVTRYGFKPKYLPDYKGLRGDPSDNIIGIAGVGEKTATILINEFGTLEAMYKDLKKAGAEEKFKKLGITERVFNLLKDGEEEALFSKTLATIRRDAPINFVIPEKSFREEIDMAKITALFKEFEFKSLIGRAQTVFGGKKIEETIEETPTEDISPRELLETSVALWLIDSEQTTPTLEDILTYTKKSTFAEARKEIFAKLKTEKLQEVYDEIEAPLMPIVTKMTETGILIDKKVFSTLSTDYHKTLDAYTKNIYRLAGEEFNINSPKQMSEILFVKLGLKPLGKKSATGTYTTKIEALESLEDAHPIIAEIMKYRELQKLLSTYIDVIPEMTGPDGRLHATFSQHGAATGRFSSQNPNLQNIPIKSELGRAIRDGFIAAPGHTLVALDYSQIELRVLALMSHDERLSEIFRDGKDVHSGVAAFVFNVPQDKVDHDMRRRAKVINFGIIYGMGVNALRKNLGSSRAEAESFYENYFRQFPTIRDYLEGTKEFARTHGYTLTLFGRKRQFPAIRSSLPFMRALAERTATNAPLQGTAADIMKLAIIHAEKALAKASLSDKAHLVLQIHDELVYEVENNVAEQVEKIVSESMVNVLPESYLHIKTDIPLAVHAGRGRHYGEIK